MLPVSQGKIIMKKLLDEPFILRSNQAGKLDSAGLTIQFYSILEDSRCSRQVDCAGAGQVKVNIYARQTNLEPALFELNANPMRKQDVIPYDDFEVRFWRQIFFLKV